MRRKDREMDREFGLHVIDKAHFGVLTIGGGNGNVDGNGDRGVEGEAYSVPVSPARIGEFIYIHSALEGTKIDRLKANPKVTMVFVGDTHIPDPITEEAFERYAGENRLAQLVSSKFTTEFESAIIKGTAVFITDENEKTSGLRAISQKFTPLNMSYFDVAAKSSISRTAVIKISIDEITAKRKHYDENGEEMKWGRME